MQLDLEITEKIIQNALNEDIGKGDITSALTIDNDKVIEGSFVPRERSVICGIPVVEQIFSRRYGEVEVIPELIEGMVVKEGTSFLKVKGKARVILAYERVALNLLQRMSGIANMTRRFADEVSHTKAKILDTRKTTPGLRVLEKYAVWIGGGKNHRFCLDDGILIKDNHISISGSNITAIIQRAKSEAPAGMKVEIECDDLTQAEEAINAGADIILLDNMDIESLKKAVGLNAGRAILEASGGVTLETVKEIAETGVDYISVGAITHSAVAVDIGLDIN